MQEKSQYPEKFNQPDFIARLQLGDETAYRELDEELYVWFMVYVQRKFGLNEQDAKDVVQDATMNIYQINNLSV